MQSAPLLHSTHLPAPSHNLPPPSLQARPAFSGGYAGIPLEQVSFVHVLLSVTVSASSLITEMEPLPSQTDFLQSPAICMLVGVSAVTFVSTHAPITQSTVMHSFAGAGQSMATMHTGPPPIPPIPPPIPPIPPMPPPPIPVLLEDDEEVEAADEDDAGSVPPPVPI